MKAEALKKRENKKKAFNFSQRDSLIYCLHNRYNLDPKEIVDLVNPVLEKIDKNNLVTDRLVYHALEKFKNL